jgi:hypothetical protein
MIFTLGIQNPDPSLALRMTIHIACHSEEAKPEPVLSLPKEKESGVSFLFILLISLSCLPKVFSANSAPSAVNSILSS